MSFPPHLLLFMRKPSLILWYRAREGCRKRQKQIQQLYYSGGVKLLVRVVEQHSRESLSTPIQAHSLMHRVVYSAHNIYNLLDATIIVGDKQ